MHRLASPARIGLSDGSILDAIYTGAMSSIAYFLAPIAALVASLGGAGPDRADPLQPATAQQVSIQQRVTVRIGPRPAPMQSMMFDNEMEVDRGPRWVERKMGSCISINSIAGTQPIDNSRLLLVLADRRMVTARLQKGCQGRDFYSGFIVARNADGQICTGRDSLQSRSGTTCQVTAFNLLVQVGG